MSAKTPRSPRNSASAEINNSEHSWSCADVGCPESSGVSTRAGTHDYNIILFLQVHLSIILIAPTGQKLKQILQWGILKIIL